MARFSPLTVRAARACASRLELAELKGHQLVVRKDDDVVEARCAPSLYVGNLSPAVTWGVLKEHFKSVDPSGGAQVRVIADQNGQSMGYGFVDFRTQAAADAAVWTLHNSTLDGRTLFLRSDCHMLDVDGAEAESRRAVQAKNMSLIAQLAAWVEDAPPLVDWGWSTACASSWTPQVEPVPALAAASRLPGVRSLAWVQAGLRLRKVVTTRMDASQLQGIYERQFGERLDFKALGCSTLREVLSQIPTLQLDSQGSRLHVAPAGVDKRRGDRGGSSSHDDRRDRGDRREDDRRRDRNDRPRDRDRERDHHHDRRGGGGGDRRR